MSRKHNTRHQRTLSHYPDRLRRRGVTNVDVRMEELTVLRNRASRRGPMWVYAPDIDVDLEETA